MKKTVWSETYKLLGEQPEKYQNKSQIALAIGITGSDFHRFFNGSVLLRVTTLVSIAKFFDLKLDEVVAEHTKNIEKYEKERNK